MRVDPTALLAAAPALGGLGEDLDGVLGRLARSLDAVGECWGADTTGQAFAEQYLPVATRARQLLPQLGAAVRGVGDAISEVATTSQATDDRAQARLT